MGSLRIRADGHEVVAGGDRALTVGRDASAEPQGWTIEDPGSRNGTYRDGERTWRLPITGATRMLLGDPVDGVRA